MIMKDNTTNVDWSLDDKFVSSDPDYCPIDTYTIRYEDEDLETSNPSTLDDDQKLNAWIFDHPDLGTLIRLFPSFEGNFTYYVYGSTVGMQFNTMAVEWETTSCSYLTVDIDTVANEEYYLYEEDKGTEPGSWVEPFSLG